MTGHALRSLVGNGRLYRETTHQIERCATTFCRVSKDMAYLRKTIQQTYRSTTTSDHHWDRGILPNNHIRKTNYMFYRSTTTCDHL